MKKLILIVLVLAVAVAIGANVFAKKAPDMLREAIERALDKQVSIRQIEFHFPWNFELSGVEIRESRGPFRGEVCFSVENVDLTVSPLSLSRRDLVVDRIRAQGALILIRMKDDELYHVLSDAMAEKPSPPGAAIAQESAPAGPSRASVPLAISRFDLVEGHFRFIDYDVRPDGFVIELERIGATIKDIAMPPREERTAYELQGQMAQGRDVRPATFQASGWTEFSDHDTDALLTVSGMHLPYFEPYLAQITPARVQEGVLDNRSSFRIQNRELIADLHFELSGLHFSAYEEGDQLFGLKAEEILAFLKDAAGRLRFQIVIQWNLADKGVKKRDIIRRSIERSLKKTVLGNLGNILENTIRKLGEKGVDGRDDIEGTLKKVKELFR